MNKYKVGDIVTTTESKSKYGTPIPAGPFRVLYTYTCSDEVALDSIPKNPQDNYVLRDSQVQPYAPTFNPGDVVEVLMDCEDPFFKDQLQAGTGGRVHGDGASPSSSGLVFVATTDGSHNGYFASKGQNLRLVSAAKPTLTVEKPRQTAAYEGRLGTGWTFRIPADASIDGKRVLKELADAGADYAVVSWGKSNDQRVCLVSQRLAERAAAHGVPFNTQVLNPDTVVPDFSDWFVGLGWKPDRVGYCLVPASTLAELANYAARVKAAERAKRPKTVRVNFGVAK